MVEITHPAIVQIDRVSLEIGLVVGLRMRHGLVDVLVLTRGNIMRFYHNELKMVQDGTHCEV